MTTATKERKVTARLGTTLFVGLGLDAGELEAWRNDLRAMMKVGGHGLQYSDGSSEWMEESPETTGLSGSAAYVWDRSGNKVKTAVLFCRRDEDGNVSRTVVKYVWKNL